MLADDPQDYFDHTQLMDRLTGRQKQARQRLPAQQAAAHGEARGGDREPGAAHRSRRATLKTSKASVQGKLAEARALLSRLTAQEKARLAAIEREKQEEAKRKAEELARQQAADAEAPARRRRRARHGTAHGLGERVGRTPARLLVLHQGRQGARLRPRPDRQAVRLGRDRPRLLRLLGPHPGRLEGRRRRPPAHHLGPGDAGTTVSLPTLQPGDLVFFYDDISHVGIYIGDGMMIHAPKPGAYVREESIYYMSRSTGGAPGLRGRS